MSKRKLRFNAVDALIILVIAAAVLVLLYVFVFSERDTQTQETKLTKIEYVVELTEIPEHFAGVVQEKQPVQDAVERKQIGTVVGAEDNPYQKVIFDYESGEQVAAAVDEQIVIKVTIEANAEETDRAFIVDGCEIRVGQQYSLIFPHLYGYGYCTSLKVKD